MKQPPLGLVGLLPAGLTGLVGADAAVPGLGISTTRDSSLPLLFPICGLLPGMAVVPGLIVGMVMPSFPGKADRIGEFSMTGADGAQLIQGAL